MNNINGSLRCKSCDKILEEWESDDDLCAYCLGIVEKDVDEYKEE